jgi:hypothetical protein
VAGLLLVFAVPPALVVVALAGGWLPAGWRAVLALLGAAAWAVMALIYLPAVRFFGLHRAWALSLPLAALLYGAMTVDSALRRGGRGWR